MGHMSAVSCGNRACDICYPLPLPDVLDALNADDYRIGQLQCLPYTIPGLNRDTAYNGLFSEDWLSLLYLRMKHEGVLERTFCGMLNLSHDAVLCYLMGKPVFAVVRWHEDNQAFDTVGMGWIGTWSGIAPPMIGPRCAFSAYVLFREMWGQPAGEVVTMLGLARMFRSYRLDSILGQRYATNGLTARFMSKFGFRDIGTLPRFMLRKNAQGDPELVDCVASRLSRKDFVRYVEDKLIEIYGA